MDIVKILGSIKGKVLDATHFELLQSAYELQSHNIEQLKENNAALTENNNLLKEKSERVTKENEHLKGKVAELEAELSSVSPSTHAGAISETAEDIFRYCFKSDVTEFYLENLIPSVKSSRLQVESAIDELQEKGLVDLGSVSVEIGPCYFLTESGKKYALGMGR